jgi:hypothetical protein
MAPGHLRTKRQLAAEGLRPNGQDIAGKLPPRSWGKPAYLYDVHLAAPKRPPTEANYAALAKANRERALRTAERHGIARTEFEQIGDPGPGWDTPAPAVSVTPAVRPAPMNAFATATLAEQGSESGWER